MKTSLSRVLDCRKAALMSTEASLKLLFAAMAISSLKISFATVELSDYGLFSSLKALTTRVALNSCFWLSFFS